MLTTGEGLAAEWIENRPSQLGKKALSKNHLAFRVKIIVTCCWQSSDQTFIGKYLLMYISMYILYIQSQDWKLGNFLDEFLVIRL